MTSQRRLSELEKKGYFEFFASAGKALDKIIVNTSAEDINKLADNIVHMLGTVKNIEQPVPSYSLLRVAREMNSPEMQKGFRIHDHFYEKIFTNQ